MPSKFTEILGMFLHGSPVSKILAAQKKCEQLHIRITARDLERYASRGHEPDELAELLIQARRSGVETSPQELLAISVTGRSLPSLVEEAGKVRTVVFDTLKRGDGRIAGKTRDGTAVSARCTLEYRLSPAEVAFHFDLGPVHEALAAKLAAYIEVAPSREELLARKPRHEEKLRWLAATLLLGAITVKVEYE